MLRHALERHFLARKRGTKSEIETEVNKLTSVNLLFGIFGLFGRSAEDYLHNSTLVFVFVAASVHFCAKTVCSRRQMRQPVWMTVQMIGEIIIQITM